MGKKIVATGRGGTGKSTFTSLASRFLPPPIFLIDLDPDQSLAEIADLAELKIGQIRSNVTAGQKKIARVDKYITDKHQQITEKSQNITQKGALKSVLSALKKFPAKLAECEDWQGDSQLNPGIKKLEERIAEIQKEVDDTVDAAIKKNAERTKRLRSKIQKPKTATPLTVTK